MYGNGCAGSTASGVSTGKMRDSKASRISWRCAGLSSSQSTMRMPAAASFARTSRMMALASAVSSCTRALIALELLTRPQAVGRGGEQLGGRLLLEAGDADLEELVQMVREDREELDALEQRLRRIVRERQYPVHEVEPRQLAVQVPRRDVDGRLGFVLDLGSGHCSGHSVSAYKIRSVRVAQAARTMTVLAAEPRCRFRDGPVNDGSSVLSPSRRQNATTRSCTNSPHMRGFAVDGGESPSHRRRRHQLA